MKILNDLIETADSPGDMELMNDLIQLLEEKFGLKIKVCGNCDGCAIDVIHPGAFICTAKEPLSTIYDRFRSCNLCLWAQKRVPEKPSSA